MITLTEEHKHGEAYAWQAGTELDRYDRHISHSHDTNSDRPPDDHHQISMSLPMSGRGLDQIIGWLTGRSCPITESYTLEAVRSRIYNHRSRVPD